MFTSVRASSRRIYSPKVSIVPRFSTVGKVISSLWRTGVSAPHGARRHRDLLLVLQAQPGHQRIRLAKPHPLAPPLIPRHGGAVIDDLLHPLPRFVHFALGLQKQRVVVIDFRTR